MTDYATFVKQDPEIVREMRHDYRLKIRKKFIKWLYYNGELNWLPKALKEQAKKGKFHIDGVSIHHIIPLSMGGKNNFSNLILMNSDIHDKIHKQYEKQTLNMNVGDKIVLPIYRIPLKPNRILYKQRER